MNESSLKLPATLPVFPLPTVVFFPGTILPLHIFEPRYKQMLQDAQEAHGIIAMALMMSGWEAEYYDSPEVHSIGCAGRISEVTPLEEGRSNIKLAGIARVLFESFDSESPYRVARVRPLPERVPEEGSEAVTSAKRELVAAYTMLLAQTTGRPPISDLSAATGTPLQPLVNTLCAHLDVPVAMKQELLRIDDVLDRCRAVTRMLKKEGGRQARRTGGGSTVH